MVKTQFLAKCQNRYALCGRTFPNLFNVRADATKPLDKEIPSVPNILSLMMTVVDVNDDED
jgi:hypothetical protein